MSTRSGPSRWRRGPLALVLLPHLRKKGRRGNERTFTLSAVRLLPTSACPGVATPESGQEEAAIWHFLSSSAEDCRGRCQGEASPPALNKARRALLPQPDAVHKTISFPHLVAPRAVRARRALNDSLPNLCTFHHHLLRASLPGDCNSLSRCMLLAVYSLVAA